MASFATIAGGFRYGFGVMYALKIEGFAYIWTERDLGASNPSGYAQDPSLVIDESSKIGSLVDRQKGIGKAFDLGVKLLDSTVNAALFKKPTAAAALTTSLAYGTTANLVVDSNTSFASSGVVYIGSEAIAYSGKSGSTILSGLTRGAPGGDWKAYTHPTTSQISTWVTNSPLFWRGKRAKLYAIPVSPFGTITGANVLTDAGLIWEGKVAEAPVRVSDGWSFRCRSFDRVLDEPVISPITGVGEFNTGHDPVFVVDKTWAYHLLGYTDGSNVKLFDADFAPFNESWITDTSIHRYSWARDRILTDFNATAATMTYLGAMRWVQSTTDDGGLRWEMEISMSQSLAAATPVQFKRSMDQGWTPVKTYNQTGGQFLKSGAMPPSASGYSFEPFRVAMTVGGATVDKIDGFSGRFRPEVQGDLPSSGWLIIEADGASFAFEYTSKAAVGDEILFATDGTTSAKTIPFPVVASDANPIKFTIKTATLTSGLVRDIMRRVLMSSGRGNNDGTYDTLPLGSGYDLEIVETSSFDNILDGAWSEITSSLVLADDTSFAALFGPLLALSQRAIVPRNDGTDIKLAAVDMSVFNVGAVAVTITDSDLVVSPSKRQPVRPKRPRNPPNAVDVNLLNSLGDNSGTIAISDIVSQRASGTTRWKVPARGIRVDEIEPAAASWARSLFSDMPATNVVEVDVAPWVEVETGDAVDLDLSHFALWDQSAGTRGYTGAARVLGRQVNLKTQIQTLTLLIQGTWKNAALAPSAKVTAISGSGGSPSSVTVDGAYTSLFQAYLASSNPFTVTAYKPSEDGVSYGYTINAVSPSGGNCILAVASVIGTFTLTTDWFLTLPVSGSSNTAQAKHMHDNDGSRWL